MRYGDQEVAAAGFQPRAGETLTVLANSAGAARIQITVAEGSGKPGVRRTVTLLPLDATKQPLDGLTDQDGRTVFWAAPGKYLATAWETEPRAHMLRMLGPDVASNSNRCLRLSN